MEKTVFILCNQHQQYLNKSREWIAAGDSKTLLRTDFRDEIINEKVELTVKSPNLRIKTVKAQQSTNGRLTINGEPFLAKGTKADTDDECANDEAEPLSASTDDTQDAITALDQNS